MRAGILLFYINLILTVMKKILLLIAACFTLQVGVFAQTNFEELTLDEALVKAKNENKLVFLDTYTSWCGPCAYMAKTVFPQKEMGDFMNPRFVCLKVDAEKGEGVEIAKRYGVTAFPTFFILTPDGEVRHKIVGGSETPAEFIARVKEGLDEETALSTLEAKYKAGDRTPVFMARYVRALLAIGDPRAKAVADDLIAALPDGQRTDTAYWFVYEDAALSPIGSPNMDYLLRNAARFQKSVGTERVNEKIATAFDQQLTNVLTGRDRQATLATVDRVERDMAAYEFPSKERLEMFADLARAKLGGNVEKLLSACEEYFPRIDHQHLLAVYFALATQIKRQGNADQQARLLKLSKQMLAETKNDSFRFSLGQFIPYMLER